MSRWRPRVSEAEHARRVGFGRIVRVHRRHRDSVVGSILIALTAVGLIVAGLFVFGLTLTGSPLWRLPVLGWTALAGLTAAWWRWGPVRDPARRRRFVVTEGGLLVWAPGYDAEPTAIPWAELHVERRLVPPAMVVPWLVWRDGDAERGFDVSGVVGQRDLIRAVELGGPVPAWPPRRLVGTAVVGLATALVLWFAAVPVALDLVLGERPDHITDLSRICAGGRAFGRADAYQGPGPHPVAVYGDSGTYPDYLAGVDRVGHRWPAADEVRKVRLVGCRRLVGRAKPDVLRSCDYQGGYQTLTYQGRYRIDVYAARTGRHVATVQVDGKPKVDGGCVDRILVRPDSDRERVFETDPDDAAYAAVLATLVNKDAAGD
jgi:hypothetical protein